MISIRVFAESSLEWYEGAIVLEGKQVRVGQIAFQPRYDVVLLKTTDGPVQVYPAHRIVSFNFYDAIENINRKFISLADSRVGFEAYSFYEVVLHGDVTILRQARGYINSGISEEDEFDFFTWHELKLTPLKQFRDKIYPMIMDYNYAMMHSYKKQEQLNPNRPADAIRLVRYYNKLVTLEATPIASR